MTRERKRGVEAIREAAELRRVMETKEGMKRLEETVARISAMVVSKSGGGELSNEQRQMVRAIFGGNGSVVFKLRQAIV